MLIVCTKRYTNVGNFLILCGYIISASGGMDIHPA